ncbi:MAG: discoidin domain-containing protein [bacterium]
MRRNRVKPVLAAFVLMLSPVSAGEQAVERLTGLLEGAESALDGDRATAATLARRDTGEPFRVYVYLKETMRVGGVRLVTDLPVSTDGTVVSVSGDIVNWQDAAVELSARGGEDGKGELEAAAAPPLFARYLRLAIRPAAADAMELKIFELSVAEAETPENVISNVRVRDVTRNSAVVEYTTLLPTVSQVRYGPWRPEFRFVRIHQLEATEHSLELGDLLEGTDYYLQVVVSGGEAIGPVYSFRTKGKPLPIILNIALHEVGEERAEAAFTGNTDLKWRVYYGEYEDGMDAEAAKRAAGVVVKETGGFETSPAFVFEGLKPRTRYYFYIEAEDDEGRKTGSDLHGFDTPARNLARGKAVKGTFSNEMSDEHITRAPDPMGRAVDGDETYFDGFAKSYPPKDGRQWVEVDLGAEMDVSEVEIVWSRLGIPERYTVEASADGRDWREALSAEGDGFEPGARVWEERSKRGDPLVFVRFPLAGRLRHLRLAIPAGTPVRSRFDFDVAILAEMKVLAP